MEQNEPAEEVKETKENEEIGAEDVLEEPEGTERPSAEKEVSNVSFEKIKKGETEKASLDMDFIMEIPLTVTVELGRGRMPINELLQLGRGSVIELMNAAGEPMEVLVNNQLIARGEVVVVNDKFGVRLTEVASPAERLNKLK